MEIAMDDNGKQGIVLSETKDGWKFVKYVHKDRIEVDRLTPLGDVSMRYEFARKPMYRHPYLSWLNLTYENHMPDNYLLYEAVQKHRKLVADIELPDTYQTDDPQESAPFIESLKLKPEEAGAYFRCAEKTEGGYRHDWFLIRRGCLADFFEFNEVLSVYRSNGVPLGYFELGRMRHAFRIPLENLYAIPVRDNTYHCKTTNFVNYPRSTLPEQFCMNGLALGYPLESTIGVIYRMIHRMEQARQEAEGIRTNG